MRSTFSALTTLLFLVAAGSLYGQESGPAQRQATAAPAAAAAQAAVPRLIMFSGTLRDLAGKPVTGPVDVTFGLYSEETDGSPLWFETQTLQADQLGHYNVMLGAMSPAGVPMELFTSGRAHWLGVQVSSLPEQSRVLLVSVPYAMKAGDAETLGGKPASAYLLSTQANSQAANAASAAALSGLITSGATKTTTTSESPVSQAITQSYIPVFTDNLGTVGNSIMFQSGTKIGINTNTPGFNLDLNGNVFIVGTKTAVAGQGGTMRFRDDTGTQRWLFGIPGSAGSQDFFMYNYTNGRAPIFIQNGAASYSLYLNANGNVGVGTSTPAQKLSVAGVVQSTSGGFKFPDGTTQTTASAGGGTATDLNCVACVSSSETSFNYAASTAKGGDASNAILLNGLASSAFQPAGSYPTLGGTNPFTGNNSFAGTVGVGTTSPVSALHVLTSGTTAHANSVLAGDAIGGECSSSGCAGVDAVSQGTGGVGIYAASTTTGADAGTGIFAETYDLSTGWSGTFNGDIKLLGGLYDYSPGGGIFLISPNGSKCAWITLDDTTGALKTTSQTCPAALTSKRSLRQLSTIKSSPR